MFEPDLDKLRALWGNDPPAESFEDFLTVSIDPGDGQPRHSPTHLFGEDLRLIPYHDLDGEDQVRDADANAYARGDAALAEAFKPGEFGYMMKHHRGESEHQGRQLAAPVDAATMKAHLKLQNSHLGLVIGVADRGGAPGAITVHNPQGFPHNKGREDRTDETWEQKKRFVGRFGDEAYSMVFFKPTFPDYISTGVAQRMIDNIRTMAIGFNAVSDYPSKTYDGNDPLAATDVERVREHAAQMVRSIAGEKAERKKSLEWFKQEAHQLYCSEFAHVASSAGIHCPLNTATFAPLVGEATWSRFVDFVERHNRGEDSPFQTLNKNPLVCHVALAIAGDDLRPLPEYAPAARRDSDARKLAFPPLTAEEIIRFSMQELFPPAPNPRTRRPPSNIPNPAEFVRRFSPEFLESIAGSRRQDGASRDESAQIAGAESRPEQPTQKALFVPPALIHFVAKGHCTGGLLGVDYVGHGLHFSLVRPRA